ncbi:MAG TPA: glycosyltransferase [Candidatus Sulfotelmatobacter sp.]|nr:glycosyltransferase [Candidatus Sulfotelmatobacter sp.]
MFYPAQPKVSKPSAENPFTIFFYARPEAPRNAFELGITALSRMKQKYGELAKIYAAGAQWNPNDYGVEKQITVLGTLPYQETATLYRKCDLGIVFMLTKHPSYLPFELMACGCPVLTNYNPSTLWMLKDGENCVLTEPTPAIVFEKIETLMNDPNLRTRIISNGLELIHQTNWETEIEKIYKFICNCS